MNALCLTTADLQAISGVPRVEDVKLGSLLGFGRVQNVRKVIRRHRSELHLHGELALTRQLTGHAGRPEEAFYLNEAQALLVCMFARTSEAATARKQIVEVFLAWRHGQLKPLRRGAPANDRDGPWALMERRIARIERLLDGQAKVDGPAFATALAYAPTVLFLEYPNGKRRRQRRPPWWHDIEVREALIASHRQMTIDMALASLRAEFGKDRAPSRSSIGRFWQLLDEVRAAA